MGHTFTTPVVRDTEVNVVWSKEKQELRLTDAAGTTLTKFNGNAISGFFKGAPEGHVILVESPEFPSLVHNLTHAGVIGDLTRRWDPIIGGNVILAEVKI